PSEAELPLEDALRDVQVLDPAQRNHRPNARENATLQEQLFVSQLIAPVAILKARHQKDEEEPADEHECSQYAGWRKDVALSNQIHHVVEDRGEQQDDRPDAVADAPDG